MLTYGLTNFDLVKIAISNEEFTKLDVWLGRENQVKAYSKDDIYKIIKKGQKKKLKVKVLYDGPIEAPIEKDQIIAKLNISYDQDLIGEYDLFAMDNIKKLTFFLGYYNL